MTVRVFAYGLVHSIFLTFCMLSPATPQSFSPECPPPDYCCGNNICDWPIENQNTCPEDCGTCGDNVCDPYESGHDSCPADCGQCQPRGCDGRCGTVVDCDDILDCGPCFECGNGVVDPGETCETCQNDVMRRPRIIASATTAATGQSITFTADPTTILDPPTPLWDLGNADHRSGSPLTYTYQQAGEYRVILTAEESGCGVTRLSNPLPVRIVNATPGNFPPVARPGGPYEGRVPETMRFDGSASTDPDGNQTIATYRWEFGDGASLTGPVVLHQYSAPSTYTVKLTVTDTTGLSDSATTEAVVTFPSPDPGFTTYEELTYIADGNLMSARATMTILPPDAMTFEARVRAVVVEPGGMVHDSGILAERYMRDFTAPAIGTWTMTVEYYFARIGRPDLQPELVKSVPLTRGMGPAEPPPRIFGPRELWWLRGGYSPVNPTSIALSASGGGTQPCSWRIVQGASRVMLSGNGCFALVQSVAGSVFRDDVSISVRKGDQESPQHWLTVRVPDELLFYSLADFNRINGYSSEISYTAWDQLGGQMREGGIEETRVNRFDDYSGNNWTEPPLVAGRILPNGRVVDRMGFWGTHWIPGPVLPEDDAAGTRVVSWRQSLSFLAGTPIILKTHKQQYYRGKGRHE